MRINISFAVIFLLINFASANPDLRRKPAPEPRKPGKPSQSSKPSQPLKPVIPSNNEKNQPPPQTIQFKKISVPALNEVAYRRLESPIKVSLKAVKIYRKTLNRNPCESIAEKFKNFLKVSRFNSACSYFVQARPSPSKLNLDIGYAPMVLKDDIINTVTIVEGGTTPYIDPNEGAPENNDDNNASSTTKLPGKNTISPSKKTTTTKRTLPTKTLPTKKPVQIKTLPTRRTLPTKTIPTKKPVQIKTIPTRRTIPTKKSVQVKTIPTRKTLPPKTIPTKKSVQIRTFPTRRTIPTKQNQQRNRHR